MNNLETKKWFVYIGDHHEGPFSVGDIQEKVGAGVVQASAYVWCEGMADWQAMGEVPDFQGAAPTASPAVPLTPALPVEVEVTTNPSISIRPEDRPRSEEPLSAISERPARPESGPSKRRTLAYLLIAGVVCLGAWLYGRGTFEGLGSLGSATEKLRSALTAYGEKVPFLARWVSPLPLLSDVSEAEMTDLKAAVKEGTREAPRIALALSKENVRTPVFYIATSLPDGARFEVTVRGQGDTLLNHMEFFSSTRASVEGHLARTLPLRMKDGSPLPMGEYTINVYDVDPQPESVQSWVAGLPMHAKAGTEEIPRNARLVASRAYFLGGEKDGAYESRLKTFHDNVRKKASDELAELKQLRATLDSQLSSTRASFRKFRGVTPAKANRKAWMAFAANWTKLALKLNSAADAWTQDALKNSMFYGTLYQRVKNANTVVNKVHELFHTYFVGRVDMKSFDTQAAALVSEATEQLSGVAEVIAKAEALPTSPSGMPQRSGL